MTQPTDASIPGKGLPWPQSLNALMAAYGGVAKYVMDATGVDVGTLRLWRRGAKPRYQGTRAKMIEFGWTEAELPALPKRKKAPAPATDMRNLDYRGNFGMPYDEWPEDMQRLRRFLQRVGAVYQDDPTTTPAEFLHRAAARIRREEPIHNALVEQGIKRLPPWTACEVAYDALGKAVRQAEGVA